MLQVSYFYCKRMTVNYVFQLLEVETFVYF